MRERILRDVPLFEGLADDEVALLASHCSDRQVEADERIFREGDDADGLYVVERGSVTIVRDAVGEPVQLLARLGPGGFFGEMGLLDAGTRTATAIAAESSTLVHVRKQDLVSLLQQRPLMAVKLRAAIIRRHGHNVASAVELSGRREVRTRIDAPVSIHLTDGAARDVVLENLSPGGACLRGLPSAWKPGQRVTFSIRLGDDVEPLAIDGNIAWRSGRSAGVAFRRSGEPGTDAVRRAIRTLLGR